MFVDANVILHRSVRGRDCQHFLRPVVGWGVDVPGHQGPQPVRMFLSPFSLSPLPSANYLPYRTLILPFARTCLSISATTFDGASEAEEASFATSSAYTVMT